MSFGEGGANELGFETMRGRSWPSVTQFSVFLENRSGGLADVTSLGKSDLPTTFAPDVARVLVVITLGLGAGLTAAAAARLRLLRPAPHSRSPRSGTDARVSAGT